MDTANSPNIYFKKELFKGKKVCHMIHRKDMNQVKKKTN